MEDDNALPWLAMPPCSLPAAAHPDAGKLPVDLNPAEHHGAHRRKRNINAVKLDNGYIPLIK